MIIAVVYLIILALLVTAIYLMPEEDGTVIRKGYQPDKGRLDDLKAPKPRTARKMMNHKGEGGLDV